MKRLHGKRALVTGAASGIGRALALRLAAEGTHLGLVDRDLTGLEQTRQLLAGQNVEVRLHACDLADRGQIDLLAQRIASQWGQLDVLVNCAGIVFYGRIDRMSDAEVDKLLAVNLHAPIHLTRRLLPLLLAQYESHVLNVASMLGLFAQSKCAAYSVSKFGLVGFGEALNVDYARYRLGVTTLCPGYVATNLFANGGNQWTGTGTRVPPSWMASTPELVADRGVAAIKANRPLVTIGMTAKLLYTLKRLAPGIFLRVPGWRRKKRFDSTTGAGERRHAA